MVHYPTPCCHRDGFVRLGLMLFLGLLSFGLVAYTLLVAFKGALGAPLTAVQTSAISFAACLLVIIAILMFYRNHKQREKSK